jgi:hypothetical protein
MEKWLVGCEAATSGVYRVFDHEAHIAVVYILRDRVHFARSIQAHDLVAFLHEATQGGAV